ncbi:MAG: hypothetical protein L3J25_04185 [Flavobacteriaceae bacterium]|nr:hypothetical protein [Flavobacteriaceae bacterium]
MKKITLLLCFLLSITAFGQTTTTLEEYNYLTTGYEDDIKNGREIKDGYELKEFFNHKIEKYNYTYYYFNELETGKTKAILMVLEKPKKNKVKYLCLPFNNAELLEKFWNKQTSLGLNMGLYFEITVVAMLQGLFDNYKNGSPLNLKNAIKE